MKKIKTKIRRVIIGAAAGAIAAAALVLSAFSFSSEADSDTSRVVEEMDGSGSYITAEAAEPEDVLNDEEAIRTVEALGATKDYLSCMTPEEIQSLSSEALAIEGLDTSLADGSLVTRGITFEIPEGYEASPDTPGMYIPKRFPIDASNMVYSEFDADYTLQMMDEAYFEQMVEQNFTAAFGTAIDVNITEYQPYTIDGVPAIRIKAEYDLDGNHVTSLMIIINGSKTYTVVYTQTHDYDRMDLFEASAASIHVQK
ncbi:MAG: hypothetical protein J5509_11345 [Lachnospiraceae bacterium]|nr:hypothetical protein [Lachnospiraceae bacterium]